MEAEEKGVDAVGPVVVDAVRPVVVDAVRPVVDRARERCGDADVAMGKDGDAEGRGSTLVACGTASYVAARRAPHRR